MEKEFTCRITSFTKKINMKNKLLIVLLAFAEFANAQYTKLIDFAGATNGGAPYGSLISDGTFLYGTTSEGGSNNIGVIFKIKPDGTGYSNLLDFAGSINGKKAYGDLISDGTFLYGMTEQGGYNLSGTIFKIKPDGSGYVKLFDFSGTANGAGPRGSLITDGTYFYGMTPGGGTNSLGVIFKIKPDGTGYNKLLDFTGPANGREPYGSLIYDGTFLYGMTADGGVNNFGTVFKIKPDGSSFIKLHDFSGIADGSYPNGTLIYDGTFLYGMTRSGGTDGLGVIFKIKPDGTLYTKLLDFTGTANGKWPYGSLISEGSFLYGMTTGGGTNNKGTVFKIKSDGSGYGKLLDFSGTANGSSPSGSLVSDGSFLYGTTSGGGTNNKGTVFKIGIATSIAENNAITDFTIYPNPTNGKTNVIINQFENLIMEELKIYNIFGESINLSLNLNRQVNSPSNFQIDLSSQPNGIYFLELKTEQGIASKKIIIYK